MIAIRIFPTLFFFQRSLFLNYSILLLFLQQTLYSMLLFLFIIALSIGVFIEAHFSARFRLKISPEEKLIAFSSQFNQLKEQLLNDKTIFEKQLVALLKRNHPQRKKRQLGHPTFKKGG
jgi:hypothetical protein